MINLCDLPVDSEGKFYHIACGPGDIAPYVIACADPERAHIIANFLQDRQLKGANREFVVYTGFFNGVPVTVMGTGIGAPATAIAFVEAAQCQPDATFIRVGTCGALQSGIAPGELIITDECIREENTTHYYVDPTRCFRSDPAVLAALVRAAEELALGFHVGKTCTTADFYAGQCREVPGFPSMDADKIRRLSDQDVLNFEMEMSVFITLACVSSYNLRAGGVTVVFCNRIDNTWDCCEDFELKGIKTALRAVEILHDTDNQIKRLNLLR